MNITRKQQIYFAVLGLGLLALVFEKAILAPDSADGDTAPTTYRVNSDPASGTSSDRANPSHSSAIVDDSTVTVAEQLQHLAERQALEPAAIRDAFSPSKVWFSDDGDSGRKTIDQIAREFKANNQLLGVLFSRGQSKAMMLTPDPEYPDEQKRIVLPVGDSIDLFKLVKVDERSAIFERGSFQILLELKQSGDNESRSNPHP